MASIKAQLKSNGNNVFPNPNFVGIDTDNILATGNLLPYTVQEDCFITSFSNDGGNGHYILKIDNFKFVDSGSAPPRQSWCFAKKGQVISADIWYVTPIITVYGLKY